MTAGLRDERVSRRRWLVASLAIPLSRALGLMAEPPPLGVTWDGDRLHVSAPRLRFLTGKPLERLKSGGTVVFLSQLTLSTDPGWQAPLRRIPDRLVVSYDLWEERFSVTRLGHDAQSKSRMTAADTERWCVESLGISSAGLTPERPFWLRLELRVADSRELASVVGEPGISITGLIELFSRKPGGDDLRWSLEAGPLRLAELARKQPRRGSRTG
jgi:hypothetical protein